VGRRRRVAPTAKNPNSIISQVPGSGTLETGGVDPPVVVPPEEVVVPPDVLVPPKVVVPPEVEVVPPEVVRPPDVVVPPEVVRPPDVVVPPEVVRPPEVVEPPDVVAPPDVLPVVLPSAGAPPSGDGKLMLGGAPSCGAEFPPGAGTVPPPSLDTKGLAGGVASANSAVPRGTPPEAPACVPAGPRCPAANRFKGGLRTRRAPSISDCRELRGGTTATKALAPLCPPSLEKMARSLLGRKPSTSNSAPATRAGPQKPSLRKPCCIFAPLLIALG